MELQETLISEVHTSYTMILWFLLILLLTVGFVWLIVKIVKHLLKNR